MFRSIEYKLILYLLLLLATVVLSTIAFIHQKYLGGAVGILLCLIFISHLHKHYNRFNKNVLFLLNAVEQKDFLFRFREGASSRHEKELNVMLNRIKDILVSTREEIIKSEQFLSIIIENVSTGVIILSDKGHIQTTNKAVHSLLGMPVFTHLNQLKSLDKSFPDLFRTIKTGDKRQITVANEREQIQVSLRASEIKFHDKGIKVLTLNNIGSELEAKEMESWIKLIRIMTHEIMNSIAPITSLTEMLLDSHNCFDENQSDPQLKDTTIDLLSTINSTAKDLMTFVQSYREFMGVATPNLASIELMPLITSILNLKEIEIKAKKVEISLETESDDIEITADRVQLTQVIINLLKNGIEALDEIPDKEIRIKIRKEENNKIIVDIANNGTPIHPDVLENIFIPFFTTKESGTGIGLSVSKYIMRLHGGDLKHSFEKGWTKFSITI